MPLLQSRANKVAERHIIDKFYNYNSPAFKNFSIIKNIINLSPHLIKRNHWHPISYCYFKLYSNFNGSGYNYGTQNKIPFNNIEFQDRKNSHIEYMPSIKEFKVGLEGYYLINSHLHISIDSPQIKKISQIELFLKYHTPYSAIAFTTFHLQSQLLYDVYGVVAENRFYYPMACLQGSTLAYLTPDINVSLNFLYYIDTGGNSMDVSDNLWSSIDFSFIKEEI